MESIINRNDVVATLNIVDSDLINLAAGHTDETGFFVKVASDGEEGILKVRTFADNERVLKFSFGWNPELLKEVIVDAGNTATNVYWGK